MNKKLRKQILYLSQNIFDDLEYNEMLYLLNKEKYNNLRVYIADKLEYYELMFSFDKDNEVLKKQIEDCNELENVIIDFYLQQIEVNG